MGQHTAILITLQNLKYENNFTNCIPLSLFKNKMKIVTSNVTNQDVDIENVK